MDRDDVIRQREGKTHSFVGEPIAALEWHQHDRPLQAAQVDRAVLAQLAVDQLVVALDRFQQEDHHWDCQYRNPGAFDKLRRQDHGERGARAHGAGSIDP